jgi:predicted nuclease with TOPRIM domain
MDGSAASTQDALARMEKFLSRLGDANDSEVLNAARFIASTALRAGIPLTELRFERDDLRLQQEELRRTLQNFKGPSRREVDKLQQELAAARAEISGLKSRLRAEREEKARLKKAAAARRRRRDAGAPRKRAVPIPVEEKKGDKQ